MKELTKKEFEKLTIDNMFNFDWSYNNKENDGVKK